MSDRPTTLSVDASGIPTELRARRQWVLWRHDRTAKNEWAKVPYRADGRGKASSSDPATWAGFDEANVAYRRGDWAGVGFVLAGEDPYVGVDLDGCRDAESGLVSPRAWRIIDALSSYAEVSPSGTGVKLILDATKPDARCRFNFGAADLKCVEAYESGRYFALTGARLLGMPAGAAARQEALTRLYAESFGMPKPRPCGERKTVRQVASTLSADVRAAAYLRKIPPAVSGCGGHAQTFAAARAIVYGFDLGADRGFQLLWDLYNPACQPPWTERELRHKCDDADSRPSIKPRGWLLGG